MKYESITEESVAALLECFYGKIRRDPVFFPIYSDVVGEDWEAHIARMREFWCSAMRVGRRYHGDMLVVHQKIGQLKPSLFPRWLARFREAVAECFTEAPAAAIDERALKIARNLETALVKRSDKAAEGMRQAALADRPGERV